MLTIKTYLAPDQYGGIGLFAAEDIKAGDVVWTFDTTVTDIYSLEDYKKALARQDDKAETLIKYAYPANIEVDGAFVKVMFHDLDNGSYINHDSDPNIGYIESPDHPLYDQRYNVNIATRDIRRGEELTNDYFSFDDPDYAFARSAPNCMTFLFEAPQAGTAAG